MSLSFDSESFSSDLTLANYASNIKELRATLMHFTYRYKEKHNYKTSDSLEISDVCNKLRYMIEQYCFHMNILQDEIQISIPIDPFVDTLDIFANDELPAFKQQNILQLLGETSHGKSTHLEDDAFNDYDKNWFRFLIDHISFILESYNYLKNWESDYNAKIMNKLEKQKETLLKPDTENKLYREYLNFKQNIENEDEDMNDRGIEKDTKSASNKVSALAFKDRLKDKNEMITKSLIRSNQVLKSSVLQTELNLEEIYIQGNLLTDLNDKFDILDTLLSQSSKIMKVIEKNGSKEKTRVYYSLGFLIVCISWVVWKRLIRGPVKLLIWIWFNFFKRILYMAGFLKRHKILAGEPIFQEIVSTMSEYSHETVVSLTETVFNISSAIGKEISNISSAIASETFNVSHTAFTNSSSSI